MDNDVCISCSDCKTLFTRHDNDGPFERWGEGETVRLINNPAAWGGARPRMRLLGFSKGATQNKELAKAKVAGAGFNAVPFKGMRHRLTWLLEALRLLPAGRHIDQIFDCGEQDMQSASLIRCSISVRKGNGKYSYSLADIMAVARDDSRVEEIATRCAQRHLAGSSSDELVLMLGIGDPQIEFTERLLKRVFPNLRRVNQCTLRTGSMSFVHVAHPSGRSQRDHQYLAWVRGETSSRKVDFAKSEVRHRFPSLEAPRPNAERK